MTTYAVVSQPGAVPLGVAFDVYDRLLAHDDRLLTIAIPGWDGYAPLWADSRDRHVDILETNMAIVFNNSMDDALIDALERLADTMPDRIIAFMSTHPEPPDEAALTVFMAHTELNRANTILVVPRPSLREEESNDD